MQEKLESVDTRFYNKAQKKAEVHPAHAAQQHECGNVNGPIA